MDDNWASSPTPADERQTGLAHGIPNDPFAAYRDDDEVGFIPTATDDDAGADDDSLRKETPE